VFGFGSRFSVRGSTFAPTVAEPRTSNFELRTEREHEPRSVNREA
jgi:hypothetical protein